MSTSITDESTFTQSLNDFLNEEDDALETSTSEDISSNVTITSPAVPINTPFSGKKLTFERLM